MVKHGSEGGLAGVLLAVMHHQKGLPYTSQQNHDPTGCLPVHHHWSMNIRLEESLVARRGCVEGTALHNIWPTGAIRKTSPVPFLGGKTTS